MKMLDTFLEDHDPIWLLIRYPLRNSVRYSIECTTKHLVRTLVENSAWTPLRNTILLLVIPKR